MDRPVRGLLPLPAEEPKALLENVAVSSWFRNRAASLILRNENSADRHLTTVTHQPRPREQRPAVRVQQEDREIPSQDSVELLALNEETMPALQPGYNMKMKDLRLCKDFRAGDVFPTYVISVMEPDCLCLIYSDGDEEGALTNLAHKIKSAVKLLPKFMTLPEMETLILARYSVDNAWYRAGIVEHLSPISAAVMYVDYGNYETVSIEDMRPLPESLAKIPMMIIPAVVGGIKAPPGGFTKQHLKTAEKMLIHSKAYALFRVLHVEANEHLMGDLFLTDEETGKRQSVADSYLSLGIAVLNRYGKTTAL